ncbi:MAG: hypothetical protein NW205_14230 [Hyphomicrobiaceae bacterium]|nr:hypothetical protein [Hyphomicrobiaceae bacterium]
MVSVEFSAIAMSSRADEMAGQSGASRIGAGIGASRHVVRRACAMPILVQPSAGLKPDTAPAVDSEMPPTIAKREACAAELPRKPTEQPETLNPTAGERP